MCSQAIDQNIFPLVLRSAQCSIARSQRLRAIAHLADLRTKGKILLIYCLATHEITVLLPNKYEESLLKREQSTCLTNLMT